MGVRAHPNRPADARGCGFAGMAGMRVIRAHVSWPLRKHADERLNPLLSQRPPAASNPEQRELILRQRFL